VRALRKLLEDISVTSLGDGRYQADLSDAWSFFTPGGGVLLAMVLNAMRSEIGGDLSPISATTVFCSPVPAGPMSIEVRLLRRGAAFVQAAATLTAAGEPGLEVIATFGKLREGEIDEIEAEMPEVPNHAELPPTAPSPKRRMRFFENFDHRMAYGHLSWEPGSWEPGPARHARWIRYRDAPRAGDGQIDLLAYVPIVDLMPPSLVHKVGRERASFLAPSLDLTIHFFERTEREWFLISGLCRRALGGIASAQVELFDEEGKLLAFATQVMMLRRWPKP
jgi:acyl-CoA thioesterase